MRALILTAGLGTRLRPLTLVRAKAAVPVNGEPMIRRVIVWLVAQGLTDLVLNVHHRPASIAAVVGDGGELGARVRYSWEDPVLGSAGGPRHALPLLTDGGDETFAIVNGDTLTDLPLAAMIASHRRSGALVTMALIPNRRPDLYGGVLVDDGRVTGFTRRGSTVRSFHFVGVQIADARAFASLQDGVAAETVMQLYPQLIRDAPGALRAHVTEAAFRDVGSPAEYLQASIELAAVEGDRMVSADRVDIEPTADVQRSAIWDRVSIGAGSRLAECIVCDGVRLPEGSRYTRCAIANHTGGAVQPGEEIQGPLIVRRF